MSRTLFWYIFWDLIKIFGLASGVLSGIMSFGGLLKPLYEFGLDISQVGQILAWSGPAMTAYSLPIAALFATTIVYGRFSADNENTACRAAGISHLSMTMPALVLGLFTAFLSLGLLCFAVPYSMLKVERIIYSNVAKLVAEQIDRTHQVSFRRGNSDPVVVFAQDATVLPFNPSRPQEQAVELYGPMIVRYEDNKDKKHPLVPRDFYMATRAVAVIRQDFDNDNVSMVADLFGGMMVPRSLEGGNEQKMMVSVQASRFGPIELPSPVRENTKFMDILRLYAMREHPEYGRSVQQMLRDFVSRDQQDQYLQQLASQLDSGARQTEITGGMGRIYGLQNSSTKTEIHKRQLYLRANGNELVRFVQRGSSSTDTPMSVSAEEIRIEVFPDSDRKLLELSIVMHGCTVTVDGVEARHGDFSYPLTVQMPDHIYSLVNRPATAYVTNSPTSLDGINLLQKLKKLQNSAISEIHARLSFAISCFILVMVGCTLGMMFRSGNFLSAFAISVVPALLSIALVVTGQHTCENVTKDLVNPNWKDPLELGIGLIWSGNAAVFLIGAVLLGRLQKQ